MTTLSICIPVGPKAEDALSTVKGLLTKAGPDLEIVLAYARSVDGNLFEGLDPRVTQVVVDDRAEDPRAMWRQAVDAASGDWISLIQPGDAIDVELSTMVNYISRTSPSVDALAWNIFQIDPIADVGTAPSVAVPESYQVVTLDKAAMLKSFFYWDGSLNSPKVPFGIHHAAIRRSLLEIIRELPEAETWTTPLPQYEWTAKVLLCATDLAFANRPMSAVNFMPFQGMPDWQPATNFPFHAGQGLTGAIAEIQFHVLRSLGSPWSAGNDFVRACMIDCLMEKKRETFVEKGNAYFAALQQFEGGHLADLFRPEYQDNRPVDRRRGLHGGALLIDRFIGGARTAPEFFNIMKSMMAPVGLICGGTIGTG